MTMEDQTQEISPEESATSLSPLEKKIAGQIEFYFGDYNMSRDKFLKQQASVDGGWIPLAVLLTFKRLREMSSDPEVIINALVKAKLELIEISEDKTKLRRNPQQPPPPTMEDWDERTFNVKRFAPDTTLDELLDFFGRYGKVEYIYMKRFANKNFRGGIYLTYATKEDAQKFIEAKASIQYKDVELTVETKAEYSKRKEEESTNRKGQKGHSKDKTGQKEEAAQPKEEQMIRGTLLKLSGLQESTKWETIKAIFDGHAKVAYVDYSIGQTEALVRFVEANTAKEALEKAMTGEGEEKKLLLNDKEITFKVLEGEEETQELVNLWKKRRERFENSKRQRDNRGRHKHRGSGNKRPRRDGATDDQPKAKHTKFENDD